MKRSIIAIFAMLALSTSAYANKGMKDEQAGKAGSTEKSSSMMTSDKMKQSMALNEIHHLNQKEIEMAKIVQNKAQSPELKQYGQTILQDHQQADKKIQELAKSQNIELSKYSAAGYEKQLRKDLEKMSGPEFDKAFVEMAKLDHKQNLTELKATASTVQNPQIQQYVDSEFVPTLEKHEKTVSQLNVGGSQAGEKGESTSSSDEMSGQMATPSAEGASTY